MPSSCCAVGCKNRHVSGTVKRFFRFPKTDVERRWKWIKAIGRDNWVPNDGSRICSDHFILGEKSDDKESLNYVPTIFPHTSSREKKRLRKLYGSCSRQGGERIEKIDTASGMLSNVKEELLASSSTGNQPGKYPDQFRAESEPQPNSSTGPRMIGSDSETSCNPDLMEPETLLYCLEETENSVDNSSLEGQKHNKSHKRKKKVPKLRPRRARKTRYDDQDFVDLDEIFGSEQDTDSAPEVQDFLTKANSMADQSTQTILEHSYIRNLEEECYNLRCELSRIKGKYMFKDMELEMFKDNDEKVKYLTGLDSYDMLKALSDILSEYQRNLVRLSSFQQLMVTLMKIKLNLPLKFFGVLFNVNLTGISRLFNETIDLLFKKLVPLYIVWPNRDDMRKILPSELSECQNCVYIIDTFELQVDLSSGAPSTCNKMDRGNNPEMYPPNRGQTVRKFLMTIAPQGSVIFISKGVVGEVSDRTIALESGFFENITPGDVILTEKELGIDDAVAVMGATLRNSSTVKSPGRALMNQGDEEGPKRLVRIKRVIQLLKKKFMILDNKIPINWVKESEKDNQTTLDKIVQVVCALSNMTNKVWTYEKFLQPNNQNMACSAV